MIPIVRDGKTQDLPVSQWAHVDSFDTATECREGGYQAIKKVKEHHDTADHISGFMAFECISTDDPRLKEK